MISIPSPLRLPEGDTRPLEQDFIDLFENAVVAVHGVGADGIILWTNQAELDLLGYTREQYIGHPVAEFHADPEVSDHILQQLANAKTLRNYQARLRCKDGSIKHVLISSNVRWDEEGKFVHTRCFTLDITERRQVIDALSESEARFRALANTVPEIIWTAAPDGTITYANDRWFHHAGISPEKNARHWPELVLHPDDRERYLAQWSQALQTGSEYEIEVRYRRHDGEFRWFLIRAVPLRDNEDQIIAWFGVTIDIHERKRAELAERLLAEAGKALAGSLDYTVRLSNVAWLAVPDLADWCAVDVFEEDWTVHHIAVAHVDPAKVALAHDLQQRYPPRREVLTAGAQPWLKGQSELYPEISEAMLEAGARDAEHYQILRDLKFRSAMVVPLLVQDQVRGIMLFVWAESGNRYDAADLALAEELARRAAIALENARAYEAEQRARQSAEQIAERIASLQAVTAELSGAITPAQVAEIVLKHGLSAIKINSGLIALLNDAGAEFELIGYTGYLAEVMRSWQRFPAKAGNPMADVVASGQPLFIHSREAAEALYPAVMTSETAHAAWAILPLLVEDRIIGGLSLSFPEAHEFSPEEREFSLTLARQCAQALERARLYQTEREARAKAEAAQESLALLAEIRERHRLAQDLHDNVAQALGYLNLKVSLTHDLFATNEFDEAEATLRELKQIIGEVYTDIRGEIFNLRAAASTEVNFLDTLRQYIDKYKRFYQLDIELLLEVDETFFEFPPEVSISLIRTIQEALINIRKHAQVNQAMIGISRQGNQIRIRIEDEGQGFDLSTTEGSSYGLKIMRERIESIGGHLEIESTPGRGTRVTLFYRRKEVSPAAG